MIPLTLLATLVLFLVLFLGSTVANDLFSYNAVDANGETVPLSKYSSAKAILVVNVASNCGFTYTNYLELTDLYSRLHSRGLEILAFPCNQFGEQEPGTNEEIQMFVRSMGIQFPVFGKVDVNGPSTAPIYNFLKAFSADQSDLGWNFVKFLVVNGFPVKRYNSRVNPKKIEKDILQYLSPNEL